MGDRPTEHGAFTVGDVTGTGIAIGHGASASVTGMTPEQAVALAEVFAPARQTIKARPEQDEIDKDELSDLIDKIEGEIKKGDGAGLGKIERWAKQIVEYAPDVLEAIATTIVNPVAGVASAVTSLFKRLLQRD